MFVAADPGVIAHHGLDLAGLFACRRRALIRAGKFQRRWAPVTGVAYRLGRFFRDYLQIEERANRARVYAIEHLLEKIETLSLYSTSGSFWP